jgi:hypothetical protein
LTAWQQDITHYIVEQGRGDPNCLRDQVDLRSRRSLRPAAITFASIDNADSHDACGVLVGQEQVGSRPWYFFVVGILKNHPRRGSRLEELQVLAFTPSGNGLLWAKGLAEGDAVGTYFDVGKERRRLRDLWRDGWNRPFPGPTDMFTLAVSGREAVVIEERSKARWKVTIPRVPAPGTQTLTAGQNDDRASETGL